MKVATYNVNGVNGRLPVLLRGLEEAEPDVVCLQEEPLPGWGTKKSARANKRTSVQA